MSPTSSQSLISSQSSDLSPSPKHPNNITKVIKRHHWKLNQVASQTDIPRRTLIDYCAGRTAVPPDRLEALSRCLSYPTSYLVPLFPEAYLLQNLEEQAKDAQALIRLQTHWQQHPTDENTLRELMVLLAMHGRYEEIEQCYARCLKELNQITRRGPDPSTSALREEFRAQFALRGPSLAPPHMGQTSQTNEAVSRDPTTDLPTPPGTVRSLPPAQSSPTHAEHIGETVFLTIAIPSSHIQALTQGPQSEQKTPALPSTLETPPFSSSDQTVSIPSQSVSPQGILVLGTGANAPSLDTKDLRGYYLASSTNIVSSLKIYSTHCQGESTTCWQQIDIYETIEQRRTMNDEHLRDLSQITRRDLITLASVSSSLLLNMRRGWLSAGILEEFLSEATASVTTCWYLLQRSDGLPTVELALPQYLPELETLVKSSSLHRQRAAYLAAQGFLLRGLVAHHRTHFAERVAHCQKAVTYASVSGDPTLLVESLRALGGALLFNRQPKESLKAYLQAEAYSKSTQLPSFLRSKILGELSHPYAKQGNGQEVVRCLDEAHATFTTADSETPVFLLADHGRHQTILYEGLSTIDLGNHAKDQGKLSRARQYWEDAADKFGKMEKLPTGLSVPVRIAAEVLIARALAYAKARDMEGFLTYFEKGAKLAKELGSEKRKQEAREALNEALEQWPNDQRITGLWEWLI